MGNGGGLKGEAEICRALSNVPEAVDVKSNVLTLGQSWATLYIFKGIKPSKKYDTFLRVLKPNKKYK